MDKATKSASELEALIVQRAGERPDCAEVRTVAVTRGDLGWRVIVIARDGTVTKNKAIDGIANELRAKYHLAAS